MPEPFPIYVFRHSPYWRNMEPTKRKVVTRSPSHTVRLLHLKHLQAQPIEGDSKPERDLVHVAALFSFIKSIHHQPFRLVWDDASYTPDFLLRFLDDTQLVVEVKPASKVKKYKDLFDRAAKKLKGHQLSFMVATDEQAQWEQRVENALFIRRYAKTTFTQPACDRAVKLVEACVDGISFRELVTSPLISRELILHLVAWRVLTVGPDLATGPADRVFPIIDRKEHSHAFLFAKWFNAEIWGEHF